MVTTTFFSTIIVLPSTLPSSGGHSSSNGAVIGGIAGGTSALVLALVLGLFYWWRNRRGNFDDISGPDRVARYTGHTDLTGTEVTPYSYEPEAGVAASHRSGPVSLTWGASGNGSMRQYRDSQALLGGSIFGAGAATTTSGSNYAATSSDGASAHRTSSIAHSSSLGSASGLGPGAPGTQPYRPLSAKEREALRARGEVDVGLAITPEEGEEDVIQHSDGGRVATPVVSPPQEIPPSYDSIPGNAT
jgi:hypothetical protein